jgi:hypothetical protein
MVKKLLIYFCHCPSISLLQTGMKRWTALQDAFAVIEEVVKLGFEMHAPVSLVSVHFATILISFTRPTPCFLHTT